MQQDAEVDAQSVSGHSSTAVLSVPECCSGHLDQSERVGNMSLLENLPHLCTATIRSRTKGTLGGSRDDPTTVFTGRACWRQQARESEILEFQKRGISVTDKIYFASNPGLDERHIITIGEDELVVRSRALPDVSVGLGLVWRVMAEHKTTEI